MSHRSSDAPPTQLLELLQQSQAFADGVLNENADLRRQVEALQARCRAAEQERDELRGQLGAQSATSPGRPAELRELEAELNNLVNLHVATWQLHSTLRPADVADAIVEICLNLVGVSSVALYLHDETSRRLIEVRSQGDDVATNLPLDGDGPTGEAVASGQAVIREGDDPIAVVPLMLSSRLVGVIVMHRLLSHKEMLSSLDYQFFDLLGRQAANALFGAYVATTADVTMDEDTIRRVLNASLDRENVRKR